MRKIVIMCIALMLMLVPGCTKNEVCVSVEIDCSQILKNYDSLDESLRDEKFVPVDGKILDKVEVMVEEGSTATQVLEKIAKEHNIQIDIKDNYAKGINYIYEKSCGASSGWVYEVNNKPVMEEYTVKNGDLISWKYICDFSDYGW